MFISKLYYLSISVTLYFGLINVIIFMCLVYKRQGASSHLFFVNHEQPFPSLHLYLRVYTMYSCVLCIRGKALQVIYSLSNLNKPPIIFDEAAATEPGHLTYLTYNISHCIIFVSKLAFDSSFQSSELI